MLKQLVRFPHPVLGVNFFPSSVSAVDPDEVVILERVALDDVVEEVEFAPLQNVVLWDRRLAQTFLYEFVVASIFLRVHDLLNACSVDGGKQNVREREFIANRECVGKRECVWGERELKFIGRKENL